MVIKMAQFPQEGSRYSKRSRMAEDRRRREGPEGQMQAAMPKFADGLRQRDLQMETHPRRTLSGRLVLAWAEVSDFKLDLNSTPLFLVTWKNLGQNSLSVCQGYRNRHTENKRYICTVSGSSQSGHLRDNAPSPAASVASHICLSDASISP